MQYIKQPGCLRCICRVAFILGITFFVYVNSYAHSQKTPPVKIISYDSASDQLSIHADDDSLKHMLEMIALESGIEVKFNDRANASVSMNFQNEPLEEGLKHLLKGRNSIMRYSKVKGKMLLVGVIVLPAGEQDAGDAKRLIPMNDEAYLRARSQLSVQQNQQMDDAEQRWQARWSQLPQKIQKILDQQLKQRLLADEESKQRSKALQEKVEWTSKQQEIRQKKQAEVLMQVIGPEDSAIFQANSAKARAHVEALLQQQLQNNKTQ